MVNTYSINDNLFWFMQPLYNSSSQSLRRSKNLVMPILRSSSTNWAFTCNTMIFLVAFLTILTYKNYCRFIQLHERCWNYKWTISFLPWYLDEQILLRMHTNTNIPPWILFYRNFIITTFELIKFLLLHCLYGYLIPPPIIFFDLNIA